MLHERHDYYSFIVCCGCNIIMFKCKNDLISEFIKLVLYLRGGVEIYSVYNYCVVCDIIQSWKVQKVSSRRRRTIKPCPTVNTAHKVMDFESFISGYTPLYCNWQVYISKGSASFCFILFSSLSFAAATTTTNHRTTILIHHNIIMHTLDSNNNVYRRRHAICSKMIYT